MEETLIVASGLSLERNDAGVVFPHAADDEVREEIVRRATERMISAGLPGEWDFHRLDDLSLAMRAYLVERGLMTPDYAERGGVGRSLGVFRAGRASLELNGVSHARILCSRPADRLLELWGLVDWLDDQLETEFTWAFDEEHGYLTALPETAGTGLRVHLTVHLPALMVTGRLGPLAMRLQSDGFALAPMWEGAGGVFQVFNRATAGKTESDLMAEGLDRARLLAERERSARKWLFRENPSRARDYVGRALGVAQQAHAVGMEEGVSLISALQVGGDVGLTEPEFDPQKAFALMRRIQPGHIVVEEIRSVHGGLDEPAVDEVRARILRETFADTRVLR
ncbi:MAG: hypothetical protein GX536_03435 [Actinobacteria bacterium]|nr:hypothetical protein [Actinomycetota bacterium]